MEVYVIRHTQVAVASGICYGQSEVELKESFKEEVEQIKERLPISFDQVYSSPLLRCSRLAQEFIPSPILDNRLKEMHFGDWEMKYWDKIQPEEIQPWYDDFVTIKTPNGERFEEVYERLSSLLNELRKADYKKVLIITHGGILRSIWCYLLQIPLQNAFKLPVHFGEVFHFHLAKKSSEDFIIQLPAPKDILKK